MNKNSLFSKYYSRNQISKVVISDFTWEKKKSGFTPHLPVLAIFKETN